MPVNTIVTVEGGNSSNTQFDDDFSTDSLKEYTITDTLTTGGFGSVIYENSSLRINTGSDIGMSISHPLPKLNTSTFKIDVWPLLKSPNGGIIRVRLYEGPENYYEVYSTDGFGAGEISKHVGNQKVDSVPFKSEYVQGASYSIVMRLSPGRVTVKAFGESLVMDSDATALTVSSFEVRLTQQDAYIDNIYFGLTDTLAPEWDGAVGICSAEDTTSGGSVRLNFGTASDGGGGAVSYNLYYAPASQWQSGDWLANNVIFDVPATVGSVCAKAYVVGGLQNGTAYRFGVRVEDEFGNEDDNANTLLATPTGVGPSQFQDDFSVDSRSLYTVTDTWTQGGYGEVLYDAPGQRLRVSTGDDIGLSISRSVSPLFRGVFAIDFTPIAKHSSGGEFRIRLTAGPDSYYQLSNSDGYGPYSIEKVVNGQKVASTAFQSEYVQGANYSIAIRFSAGTVTVEAFGQVLVMDSGATALTVSSFEVLLIQQDAYIDNIIFSDQPFVAISRPQSYDIQTDSTLQVEAFGGNFSPDWGVQFTLENKVTGASQVVNDFAEPYDHAFQNLSLGEYTLEARIIDSNFILFEGESTRDLKDPIGIGDYYVAFGDSITNGEGDDIAFDNLSNDSRTVGDGYRPILSDLLTSGESYPHFIANGGKGGDDSSEGLARLPEVLAAHSEANYYLILFGTNDSDGSLPIPSGMDGNGKPLNPEDSGYAGSYLDNMQRIIDAVYDAGKQPILAKVPITLGPCSTCVPFALPETASRNLLIQDYNAVIEVLVSRNNISAVPPDFYNYFRLHQDEFSDNLHPNGLGYQSIADLWFNALELIP